MDALLLTYGQKEDYIGYAKLIGIKTPNTAAFVGFSSQEVGAYFLQKAKLDPTDFDLVDIHVALQGLTDEHLDKLNIVIYQNETDVDNFLDMREHFPYPEYVLSASEILE